MTFLEWLDQTGLYGSLHYEAYKTIWDAVQKYEREECAQLCDDIDLPFIASAIRERGEA